MRIETVGRLIQNGDGAVLDQNLRHAEPLAHAVRKAGDVLFGHIRQTHAFQRVVDARIGFRGVEPCKPCRVAQVLARRHGVVEADIVGQVADGALDRQRLAQRVQPGDAHLALARFRQSQQDQDHRGLAGAVRPQKPEDLAPVDGEIKPRDGLNAAVALDEIPNLDHGLDRGISLCRAAHLRPYRRTPTAITRRAAAMTPSPVAPHKVEVATVTRKSAEFDTPEPDARTLVM